MPGLPNLFGREKNSLKHLGADLDVFTLKLVLDARQKVESGITLIGHVRLLSNKPPGYIGIDHVFFSL